MPIIAAYIAYNIILVYIFFLAGTNSRDCRFQFKNWVVWPNDYRVDCQAIISSSQCIIHVVALVNVCCHPQPLDARPSRTHCHPSSSSHFHINHNHQRTTSTTPYNKLHADAACHSKCKLKLAAGALAISGSKQRDADLQRQSLSLSDATSTTTTNYVCSAFNNIAMQNEVQIFDTTQYWRRVHCLTLILTFSWPRSEWMCVCVCVCAWKTFVRSTCVPQAFIYVRTLFVRLLLANG